MATITATDTSIIRPFRVDIPEADLADLRQRLAATRLPEQETVSDNSQGVRLATVQKLARYWANRIRLAQDRSEAECLSQLHHRDRRPRHPLHPCPLEA